MPDLTLDELTVALAIVAGVALAGLIVIGILALQLHRMRRQLVIVRGDNQETDIIGALETARRQLDAFDRRIDALVVALEEQAELRRLALQRFGLVRYDAFQEMGGQLSFSAALLDDRGDGIMITSINGRTETRTYAKPLKNLDSEHNLSEEERQAISIAASSEARTQLSVR
ncbi:MAG TPA: DUF4446 family protein [Actinomycetota bacterium]|nr:DUF4446 family protein [Actinomycetota bacterium]